MNTNPFDIITQTNEWALYWHTYMHEAIGLNDLLDFAKRFKLMAAMNADPNASPNLYWQHCSIFYAMMVGIVILVK